VKSFLPLFHRGGEILFENGIGIHEVPTRGSRFRVQGSRFRTKRGFRCLVSVKKISNNKTQITNKSQ
jgi:hypothetical protein